MKHIKATVIANHRFSHQPRQSGNKILNGFRLLWLECPNMEKPIPGQFIMIRCGEECVLPRPFSIHQVRNDKIALWIAVWEGGKGTQWLSKLQSGDSVELFGPLGNSFYIQPDSNKLLLLAGGVGIAPLLSLAQEAVINKHSVVLINGASSAINLYPGIIHPEIEFIKATEDGSAGYHGMITDLLPKHVDWADQVFACGTIGMYRAMAQMTELKGKSVQVSLEVRMGCGRGICYGCTIKTKNGLKRVCEDGPVFDLDEVIWDSVSL